MDRNITHIHRNGREGPQGYPSYGLGMGRGGGAVPDCFKDAQ